MKLLFAILLGEHFSIVFYGHTRRNTPEVELQKTFICEEARIAFSKFTSIHGILEIKLYFEVREML